MGQTENCGDGIDNDGDGLIDCYDGDCQGVAGCEDFFFNPPTPECGFSPPELEEVELGLLFETDQAAFPIDQRSGVVIGDMNGDGIPDLVSRDNSPARIQIFSGDDGRILQSILTPRTHPFGQTAIADVDRDGLGDVFQMEYTGQLARYEFGNPNAVWRTGRNVGDDNSVSIPQIADVNQDGRPEVYVGDRVFDAITGVRYVDARINVGGYAGGSNSDRFPIYYDLYQPGDPKPGGGIFGPEANGMEYIAGNQVHTIDIPSIGPNGTPVANSGTYMLAAELNATSLERDGFTSIADINGDGRMDIAVMDGGRVYAWDPYTNEQIGATFNIPSTSAGGRINIGDFNGDGDVELGFAGANIYIVRQYSGTNGDNNGVWTDLWRKTGLDDGSQRTGSTLFDFDGNGTVEVVYSEEENLFIYDGPTGDILFQTTSRSGTRTEYPLVADVNGDGTAEIIVTAQDRNGPQFSGTGRISVYSSANQPWVPARQVWNQHGYNVTNINDDLTVPQFQQDNLNPAFGQRYNNFLVQTAVGGAAGGEIVYPAPDGIIEPELDANGVADIDFSNCPNSVVLRLIVENDGDAPFPGSTPIAFYDGDPRTGQPNLFTTTTLGTTIAPGETVTLDVEIDVSQAAAGSPIFLSVNDPGFASADLPFGPEDFPLTGTPECDYSNNVSNVGNVRCGETCGNGRDDDGDGLVDEPNLTPVRTTGCPRETLPAIIADVSGGTWSVVGGSTIGTTVDQNGVVTLGRPPNDQPVMETIRYDDGICFEDVVVTTVDNTPPTVVCPGNQEVALDASCSAVLADFASQAQFGDNCFMTGVVITSSQSPAVGSSLNLGANPVTITATDESGNQGSCTFTVTAVDRINPTITCPANADVTVDAQCNYTLPDLTGGGTVADNCSATGAIIITQSPVAGQVRSGHNTTVTVTLTARDEAGNRGNCSYVLTLKDETPPVLTCPTVSDQTAGSADCEFALFDYRGQVRTTDNCTRNDLVTLTQSPPPGTRVGPGTTIITITGRDQAGNEATCTISQTVIDRNPPQLVCPSGLRVSPRASDCQLIVPDIIDQTTIMDNCGVDALTVSQSPAAGTVFMSPFFQNVTVTATDAQGNSNICVSTILPGDPPPPAITCPAPTTLALNANCSVALPDFTGQATTTSCGTTTVSQQPAPGSSISANTTVTLTVRDNAGQTATCDFLVSVVDNTPPVVTCPSTQTIAVDGTCEVPLPDYTGQASATDNCTNVLGAPTLTQSPAAGTMYDINDSPVTVTLTATDASNNTGTCTFSVELMDNQPPQISCPVSPQTDPLDANCNATIPDFRTETMVSSTCSMSGFALSQVPSPGTVVSGEQTIPITITASDNAGNTVTCTFNYETEDVTSPTIICPADQVESLDASCNFTVPDYTGMAIANDNCSSVGGTPLLTVTQMPAAGTVVTGNGTETTIVLTATDAAGNATTCDFTLTTEDDTAPTVTCPTDQERSLSGTCVYELEDLSSLVTTADNCPGAITLVQTPAAAAVSATEPGTIAVTVVATDAAGNMADCFFSVNVVDDTPPSIICPADLTVEVDASCTARIPNLVPDATAADNCQGAAAVTITQDITAGTTLTGDGTTQVVTLTATDGAGLTATCTTTVTLDDVTNPTVTCPAALELDLDPTGCSVDIPDYAGTLTLADNCTAAAALAVQQMPAAGTTLMGANTVQTVSFDVNDGNGNTGTCSFQLTLRDVTDPVVTCPANATLSLDANCSVPLPDYTGSATATDDCVMMDGITFIQSPAAGTNLTFAGDQRMVTLTAFDGNGNSANCTFTVMAEDQVPPSITCPADRDLEVDANCTVEVPDFTGEATVADNCSEAAAITVTQIPAVSTVIPADQLDVPQTVTLTATDAVGNTNTCTFTFTPVDATDPAITCPDPQTILLDAAACTATLGDYIALATVTDNCTDAGAITVTQGTAAGTTYQGLVPPQIVVQLTAADASGNTASCDLTVFIRDEIAPTVDCSAANVTIALDENCNGVIPDLTTALVTDDNCSPNALTFTQTPDVGAEYNGDGTTVTVNFTVEDASGNSVACTSTVTFEDQSPPNPVICPDDTELKVDDTCPVPLPDYTGGVTVLDNCRAEDQITLTQSPAPGTMVSGAGTVIPVTITADDGNGNTATCDFDITLIDDTAVELTCPGGQLVIASSDNCDGEIGDYLSEITAVNQCMVPAGMVTFVQSPAPGDAAAMLDVDDLNVPQTVTVTATDINNNVTTCTFEVTLVDTLAPVLTCPPAQVIAVDESCFGLTPDYTGTDFTTITDNCNVRDSLIITQSPGPGDGIPGPDAVRTVTVTATDPSGNQGQCTFVLTVEDQDPPNMVCPAADTVLLNADCEVALGDYISQTIADDNCTDKTDITVTQSAAAGTIITGHLTTETVTITGTDGSGNTANCSFTVTAIDTIKPAIACPGDQIVRPDGQCEALLPDYRDEVITTDNCSAVGMITLTQRPAAGELLSGEGDALQVTIVADDGNGNLDSCTFLVSLEDNTPPSIVCPDDVTIPVDENCNYSLADLTGDATVLDNCTDPAAITVTQSVGIGGTFSGDGTTIPVTLTADDGNGNTAQCVTTITLADTISPTIVCPENQIVNPDASCAVTVADYRSAIVDDNCTVPDDITVSQSLAPGSTLNGEATTETVTLIADDGNGNTTSCSFTVTLEDITPPAITCPAEQTIFVDGSCSVALPDYTDITVATDNCTPAPAIAQNAPAGTMIDTLGAQTVTMTADDGNGNTTDCSFTVNVVDNTAPVLTCPTLSVIPADENCTVSIADYRDSITVADNCGPTSMEAGALTLVQSPVAGTEITDLGTERMITLTATDPSGNSAMCMITVEVADTTRPTIVCPADTTLAVDGNCSALIPDYTALPEVADNCAPNAGAGAITVTQQPAAGTMVSDEASLITITLTATDAAGNFITCDFDVQLIDSVPPSITCPADQVVEVDADCSIELADYRSQATATDNCSQAAELTFEQRPAPGTVFTEDGTIIPVTIVAVDQSGNRDSCEFNVTLDDAIDPVIVNCPNDSTVFVDASCAFATPDFWDVSSALATDNCRPTGMTSTTATGDQIVYTQTPAVGEIFTGGMTTETVTLTADDGNGNVVSCVFELSLSDTISPVITVCPADTTANPNADCEFTLEDYTIRATATDNCVQDGALVFDQSPAPGTVVSGQGGVTEITITATDASGNLITCAFELTLEDTISPMITCPDPQVQLVDEDCQIILADYTNLAMTDDNCSAANVTVSQVPLPTTTFTGVQTQTVTLTADDGNGNTTDCTFTVSIEDEIDPALTCPTTSIIPADTDCSVSIANYVDSVAVTDNCDAAADIMLVQDIAVGTTIEDLGATLDVTITATDQSGNTDVCVITVELIDTISPTLVCPPDTVLGVDAACNAVLPDYRAFAVPADNCNDPADIGLAQSPPAGTPLSTEDTEQVVTVTAMDASGNEVSCDFTVTLIDTIAPTVACPPDDVISVDGSCLIMIPDYTQGAQPADNCTDPAAITLSQDPAPGTEISGDGTTETITITATDASGNSSTCTLTLTLEDSTEPMITCPVDQELTADDDCEVPIPDYTGDASVSSTCDQGNGITIVQVPAPGTPISGHNTTEEITLLATDASGNSTSCTFMVTLLDRTAPVITGCPTEPIVEQVDADCTFDLRDYWEATTATATDNCRRTGVTSITAAANQINYTQTPDRLTTISSGMGSQTVTLTADDTYGNQSSCQITIVLQDTVAPVITVCSSDTTANPDASCSFTLEDYTLRATATDNCIQDGDLTFAQTPVPGTVVANQGTVTEITISATDANGNVTTCSFELTLADTISPSITCPVDQTETLSATCTDTIADYTALAVVDDNCTDPSAIVVTQEPAPGTVFTGVQTQTITLTADDGNGNTTSCDFTLNIVDEIDPELTCPDQSVIPADANCEVDVVSYLDSVSVTDNCDAAADIDIVQDVAVGETITGLGSTIDVTVTATDQSGNTDQCVITVVLLDTIAPVLTCVPDTVLGTDGSCNAILPDYRPVASATDNCNEEADGGITFDQSPAPGTPYADEATSFDVTITATDATGNSTSCTFSVQLIDTIAPEIVCPSDQVVEVDGDCEIVLQDYRDQATSSDNCSTVAEITEVQRPAPGTVFSGEATIVPVTIIATDQSGNVDSCTFTVELNDVTPPTIANCQTDTIGIVDGQCDYVVPDYWSITPVTANDNCRPTGTTATTATGDQIAYTQVPAPGTVLTDAFTTQVITLTADDGNGNTVSCDFLLTLTDTTAPTIVCPADTIANPDTGCDFALEDYRTRAAIADNCTDSIDLVVTQEPAPGTVISGQATTQTISLTVTDPSGNETTCSFDLTLQDTISPSIVCPQNKVEELDATCSFTIPDYTDEAVVADNCTEEASITITQEPAPGTEFSTLNEADEITVILTADDGNGNTTTCDFTVILDDVLDPVITCPADTTIFVDANCAAPLPDLVAVTTATDNCNPVTITQAPLTATEYNGDDTEIVVTLTADDGNGNTSDCQVTVMLQDTISPSIICPPNETLFAGPTCEVGLPDYTVAATIGDNCTSNTDILVTQDISAGTVFSGEGTMQVVTLTADDGNGNTTRCTLEITVDDAIPPSIDCPVTQTQFVTATCDVELADYTALAVTDDNCTEMANIVVTQDPAAMTSFDGVQNTVVTLTADDGNGNTAECQFTVRFEDNTAPSIVCPPSQTIDFGEDCQFTLPDYRSLALLDDNCTTTPPTITQSPSIDSIINDLGTVTEVTLTAEDASGNTSQCQFVVTTVSPTPPPAFATVTLAVVGRPTGSGVVNLEDALDPTTESNLSAIDLDRGFDEGPGPYLVTYYLDMADADAEQGAIEPEDFDPSVNGETVLVRLEDPETGCFTLSQILIDERVPGVSDAIDATSCSRPGTVIEIDGRPQPGRAGTMIVRHEWRVISDGGTDFQTNDLINADQQVVSLPTSEAQGSGTIVLEYQFFEDYGDGPVVPSVPKRVSIEILKVGGGDFFWDGEPR
ncbi:hypothetical protein A3850_006155 [Lewinella sp. 4G2]|nr:hypothetical protein A3850_006155 [Lewinella sp. 4G2]